MSAWRQLDVTELGMFVEIPGAGPGHLACDNLVADRETETISSVVVVAGPVQPDVITAPCGQVDGQSFTRARGIRQDDGVGRLADQHAGILVAVPAKLCFPGDGFKGAVLRTETEIPSANVGRRPLFQGSDVASAVPVGAINPIIEAVNEAVCTVLLVAFSKAGEQFLDLVRLSIPVFIFTVENIGRRTDQNSIAPGHETGGKIHVLHKHGGFVIAAIAICILEHADCPAWFTAAIDSERIIAHLDNPKSAVRAPIEINGVDHHRFRRLALDSANTRPAKATEMSTETATNSRIITLQVHWLRSTQ